MFAAEPSFSGRAGMAHQKFHPLTDAERAWIATHLAGARLFLEAMLPSDGDQSATLENLDRAWTAWLQLGVSDDEQVNHAINVVGVQFGQLLVDRAGFEWIIAADKHGTDLAIRALPGTGDVVVYPANFVAKRWERREADFLEESFALICQQLTAIEGDRAVAKRRPWWQFWAR